MPKTAVENQDSPGGTADRRLPEGEDRSLISRDVSGMDDFQVIAERRQIMTTLAMLTDRYRELNQEVNRRETLQWMLAR